MKNIHPLQTEDRRAKRLKKLGCEHPFCLYCGCSEPMLLRRVTRKFLQNHHIFGLANDRATTLALCFNCHGLATENLLQAGVSMERDSNPLRFASNVLRAMAVHHSQMTDAGFRFADLVDSQMENTAIGVVDQRRYDDIIGVMFGRAWPIWKVCRGKVPKTILKNLEVDGDWPSGSAAIIMRRISGDEMLRLQLQMEKW